MSVLQLLILDEAHVYDGVFGTNMAYFLRRIQAVSSIKQIISSTATIGEPSDFLQQLTGRETVVFDHTRDGSPSPGRTILVTRPAGGSAFERYVDLLKALAQTGGRKFIAFADSRKMVEQLVAAASRRGQPEPDAKDDEEDVPAEEDDSRSPADSLRVLPYRAGYEEIDRVAIQRSLERGDLAGVVSTSALELGIDIGDLDIVALLGTPPTVKSFWQRIGRGGRRNRGVCILVDDIGVISEDRKSLDNFLAREPEPGWLYLENRYIQYANALCAAMETASTGLGPKQESLFSTLPALFLKLLKNEINPTEPVPGDLYPLKQRAQAGPHYEFPIRSGIEKSFSVKRVGRGPDESLGTLTFSQSLREAYPGAIHYYMARPYRVIQFSLRRGEIVVRRARRLTTQPQLQNMVFPRFPDGVLSMRVSPSGFLAEAELQVSERVLGFVEQRGSNRVTHVYEPGSNYAQKPIQRFVQTTGVCWFFDDREAMQESLGSLLLEAFSAMCGVQSRDVGLGTFHAKQAPHSGQRCQGLCIYDGAHGSLRLTEQFAERFDEVLEFAEKLLIAAEQPNPQLARSLTCLRQVAKGLVVADRPAVEQVPAQDGDWMTIIAPEQKVLLRHDTGAVEEVFVIRWRYTPQGLMYELKPPTMGVTWMVRAAMLVPIHGETRFVRANMVTGEEKEANPPS